MHRRQDAGRHCRVVNAVQEFHRVGQQIVPREYRRPQLMRTREQRADEHTDKQRDVQQFGHVDKIAFVFEQEIELYCRYVKIPEHIRQDKYL